MRATLVVLFAVLALSLPSIASARGCPPGTIRDGNRCVRCPSGFTYTGGRCVKYRTEYRCRPGCTYIGGGKCRCYRHR